MTIEQIGEMLLGVATSEQAAGVAAAFLTGLILQGFTGASNGWKFAIAMIVSLAVAPAALGLRVYFFKDAFTQESLSSAIFVSVAVAQATYMVYRGLLGAAANRVEAKKIEAAVEHYTPISYEVDLPPSALIPQQPWETVTAVGPVKIHLPQHIEPITQPPTMTPVYLNPFEETNAINPINEDTPILPQESQERIIKGWHAADEEGGQFIPNDEGAQWVKGKVSKFPTGRTVAAQEAAIKGKTVEPPPAG